MSSMTRTTPRAASRATCRGKAVRFDELLTRADDEVLQQLISPPVVRLLNMLDPALARPTRFRELLTSFHRPKNCSGTSMPAERCSTCSPEKKPSRSLISSAYSELTRSRLCAMPVFAKVQKPSDASSQP